MAMGKRKPKQQGLWVSTDQIPKAASHPFYVKVNQVLERHTRCCRFYFHQPHISRAVLPVLVMCCLDSLA